MNPTLVHTPFPIDGPVGSDSDYITQERVFPGPAGLSADDLVDHNRRPGSLAHPISVPVSSNGFRFAAHQQAGGNNEVPFQQSNSFLLSPADSCSGSGPPSANSASSSYGYNTHPQIYSNNVTSSESFTSAPSSLFPSPLWNEKSMSEYNRPRVPAPHLPGLSPPTSQANPASMPANIVNGGRFIGDSYSTPSSYQVQRPILSPPHVGHPEISRFTSGFSTSPPHIDNSAASSLSSPGTVYSNPPNMPYEHSGRGSNPSEEKTPPFEKTVPLCRISNARNQPVEVEINAKISKGFFKVDSKWTCYRRNYFSVTCGFSLHPPDLPSDIPLYLQRSNQTPEAIHKFYVAISAKTAINSSEQESETRDLVQHTPKRDKASESTPVAMPVRPAQSVQSAVGGIGNRIYGYPASMMTDYSSYAATSQTTPMSHTFERIQFVKATANNGKRRAQQQYYNIVVDLLAEVGNNRDKIKIATIQSDPMVVRGRSPGHYKDNERKGSHTNGDPDRGPGSGHEVGGGSGSMPPSMSHRHMSSSMDWEPSHGRGSQMGGRNYTSFNNAACIPASEDSSSSSPDTGDFGTSETKYQTESAISLLSGAERSNPVMLEEIVDPPNEMMSEPGLIRYDSGTERLQPAPFMEVNQTWQPVLPSFPSCWSSRSGQRRLPALDGSAGGPMEPLSSSNDSSQYSSHQALPFSEMKLPGVSQSRDMPISENYVAAF